MTSLFTLDSSPRLRALPPLALYIHIPWCVRKCPYCDFNSHEARGTLPEKEYVDALIADLEGELPRIWGRRVRSVFIGGGTPSLFQAASIDALLAAVRARVDLAAGAEITLEANPGTFEVGKFAGFRAAGVTRLSIGVQSFDPAHLRALGRIHDDIQARRAIETARRVFDNINVDLMYGLPEQDLAQALADVEAAIGFEPDHISAYHLTLEPNTYFHRYPPLLPADDDVAAMQDAIEARLAQAGFEHYETSAFARHGRRCAHNLNYWEFGDYLGLGAGAHGKRSAPERVLRQARYRQPAEYLARVAAGAPVQREHEVPAHDLGFEFMLNALRLIEGFATDLFEQRTGLPLTRVLPALARAEQQGLIVRDHARIAPTQLGQRFLNDLLQLFLPDCASAGERTRAAQAREVSGG